MIDNPCLLEIMGDYEQRGSLSVNTIPTNESGSMNMAEQYDLEQQCVEEPEEMLGYDLWFKINISEIIIKQNEKERLTNVYC